MWNRIEEILSGFKPLFSRASAYAWHVVIVIGLMIRSDKLGLTSVIRDLALRPETYEPMLHFFRSDAWDLERVRSKWAEIVACPKRSEQKIRHDGSKCGILRL